MVAYEIITIPDQPDQPVSHNQLHQPPHQVFAAPLLQVHPLDQFPPPPVHPVHPVHPVLYIQPHHHPAYVTEDQEMLFAVQFHQFHAIELDCASCQTALDQPPHHPGYCDNMNHQLDHQLYHCHPVPVHQVVVQTQEAHPHHPLHQFHPVQVHHPHCHQAPHQIAVIVEKIEFDQLFPAADQVTQTHQFHIVIEYACGVTLNAASYKYHQAPHHHPQFQVLHPHPPTTNALTVAIIIILDILTNNKSIVISCGST